MDSGIKMSDADQKYSIASLTLPIFFLGDRYKLESKIQGNSLRQEACPYQKGVYMWFLDAHAKNIRIVNCYCGLKYWYMNSVLSILKVVLHLFIVFMSFLALHTE